METLVSEDLRTLRSQDSQTEFLAAYGAAILLLQLGQFPNYLGLKEMALDIFEFHKNCKQKPKFCLDFTSLRIKLEKTPSQVAVQQLGEYLVSANLCRMNLTVSFTPRNFPDIDIIAADESLNSVLVQVKTIHESRSRDWQLHANKFLEIKMLDQRDGRVKQVIAGKLTPKNPDIIWAFVKLHQEKDKDEFFICSISDVQEICLNSYSQTLAKINGIKKENSKSTHFTISVRELERFRDKWEAFHQKSLKLEA